MVDKMPNMCSYNRYAQSTCKKNKIALKGQIISNL